MKYKSKRGTIINIPDGLNPKQIAAIKADADSGYGTRAQQTAQQLGKKIASRTPVVTTPGPGQVAGPVQGAAQGAVDTTKTDAIRTFDPNDQYWKDLYNTTYQNEYGLATHNLDQRKAREMEDAKQEAANRGLPYDPSNRESAYGKVIGGVNDRYDDLYGQATSQAQSAAQGVYNTQGGLVNQSFVATLQEALGISEAEARNKANEISKYGIDEDTKTKMANIKAQKQIANQKSSGGGNSGGSSSDSGGFEILA